MSNELTQKQNQSMINIEQEFIDVGGTGFENVTASDLLIPRLTILQGLSPQVSRGKPEYDENAKVGDIYDVGLQERFPEGVEVVCAHYTKAWLEWAPRQTGKGLVAIHESGAIMDETERNATNQPTLANGNLIAETAQFYCLNLTTKERRKSFIPMASTQLKKARRLLTLATGEKVMMNGTEVTPPLFWRSYFLTTVPESNAMGNWMGWKIERGPQLVERPDYRTILTEIKEFRKAVAEGRARGDLSSSEEPSEKAF